MANGFEYPIEGRLNGFIREGDPKWDKWMYEIQVDNNEVYHIDVDDVVWLSSKKRKYKHLKVVELRATKIK